MQKVENLGNNLSFVKRNINAFLFNLKKVTHLPNVISMGLVSGSIDTFYFNIFVQLLLTVSYKRLFLLTFFVSYLSHKPHCNHISRARGGTAACSGS